MEEKKQKEESLLKQLFNFAGNYKYLSILSAVLAALLLRWCHFIISGGSCRR